MSNYFSSKRGEIKELQHSLADPRIDVKMQAIRQIIAAMTVGKDVSMLFMDVLKNIETNHIELKKLVYLYVMNYAKTKPDQAILGISTFRKNARDKTNPILKALAIRTMGSIRITQVVNYLIDVLKACLEDEDPYVRKTSVLCVAKMYELDPKIMEDQGFLKVLNNMLTDGNAMVVSNTVAALSSIQEGKDGTYSINLSFRAVQKLLTALNETNEWGSIVIIDNLVNYIPQDGREAEDILERAGSRISHSNPGVVIATVRLIMKYMDYLTNPDLIRQYCKKLAQPLISLVTGEPEIAYVALKNINLILQKRPNVLEKELKMFYCQFNDPIYIKLEKLEVLVRLADLKNIDLILRELRDYTNEVDVEFVRKSIRTIGRCAIKLEKAADRCVNAIWELLKSGISYIVQEAIIVTKDIFRKYPGEFEALLRDLCNNLKMLEEPEAKSSMLWIIGEYVDVIDNADEILYEFYKNFKDEQSIVQLQLLTAYVKLYLKRPSEVETITLELLQSSTEDCDNPDLRDRAFIYWRLLSSSPETAQKVVFAEKPPISDSSYTMETALLDKLVENIGTLSSVYTKPPEQFIKRLRERQNLKTLEEQDDEDADEEQEYVDSTGQKAGTYEAAIKSNDYEKAVQNNEIDLLGMDDPTPTTSGGGFGGPPSSGNVKIPYKNVIAASSPGQEKGVQGLSVDAAFQRENNNIFLELKVQNGTQKALSDFAIKFQANPFKIAPDSPEIVLGQVNPGSTEIARVECNFDGATNSEAPESPYIIKAALKTSVDFYIFQIPVSLSVMMIPTNALSPDEYQSLGQNLKKNKEEIEASLNKDVIKQKLESNNVMFVISRTNPAGVEMMSFNGRLINGMQFCLDLINDQDNGNIKMLISAQHDSVLPLLYQAFGFILKL